MLCISATIRILNDSIECVWGKVFSEHHIIKYQHPTPYKMSEIRNEIILNSKMMKVSAVIEQWTRWEIQSVKMAYRKYSTVWLEKSPESTRYQNCQMDEWRGSDTSRNGSDAIKVSTDAAFVFLCICQFKAKSVYQFLIRKFTLDNVSAPLNDYSH